MTSASPPLSPIFKSSLPPPISGSSLPPVNNQSMYDENSGPYYLHHGDSPGVILVSQLLVVDNYPTRCCSMEMALSAKNKTGFKDGSNSKPSAEDSRFGIWPRCNSMVISWKLNSISKDLPATVIYIETTKEIWSDLKDRFSRGNGHRIFQLQKAISSLSQDQMMVSSYFTKLKALSDELGNYKPIPSCSCGAMKILVEIQQQEHVMKFLMGLKESYSNVRGQILLIDPLPPLNKAFSLVLQEEKQQEIATALLPTPNSLAFFNRSTNTSSRFVPRYGNNACDQLVKRDRPLCSHCGVPGHTVDNASNSTDIHPIIRILKLKPMLIKFHLILILTILHLQRIHTFTL